MYKRQPLRFHWYDSEPLPLAATLKRAELPSTIVWGAGWVLIVGGVAPPPGAGTAMTPGLPPPLPQAVDKTTLNRSPIFLAVAQNFMMPPPSGASRRDALLLAEPFRGTRDRRKGRTDFASRAGTDVLPGRALVDRVDGRT